MSALLESVHDDVPSVEDMHDFYRLKRGRDIQNNPADSAEVVSITSCIIFFRSSQEERNIL